MNDEIVAFIRERTGGVPSEEIAEHFLKFRAPNKKLADIAVEAILSKDVRVCRGDNGLWAARECPAADAGGTDLSEAPWIAVYLLADTVRKTVAHISLWIPAPDNKCICSVWLKNPAQFSDDDRRQLCDPRDSQYEESTAVNAIDQIVGMLADKIPVFFSQQQYSILALRAQSHGINAGIDDYYLMNQLFRVIGEPEVRPLTLENAAEALLGGFRTAESAYQRGEQFCRIVTELIGRMKSGGIETRGQLDSALYKGSGFDFTGKAITSKMIEELPAKSGIYGFTDRAGAYIYIGKAVNLKRRIENYFRFNSESPEKLGKLRDRAHGLTIYRCGSELEALIYEYRLIKKHKPPLNSQQQVSERRGTYKPLPDSVVLLPHVQEGFGVSVWVRQEQKVKIRSYELTFCEEAELIKELQEYFYAGALPAAFDDFPELEIVTRWVKRRRDDINIINVGNMVDARDIVGAMKNG